MTFPYGFQKLAPGDLKKFGKLYEDSCSPQPFDGLGKWFV
jgi:hypothetical protein